MDPHDLDQCNVFVKYLPSDMNDASLYGLFSPYGEIISSKVMTDYQTGQSLGYGFVRFTTPQEAHTAINFLSGRRIANKTLLCKLSNAPSQLIEPSNNLYIRPLLPTTTEGHLRSLYENYGNILDCKVLVDKKTLQSRQIGFVRYEKVSEATAAIQATNGTRLDPSYPPLVVKYAENESMKAQRKARSVVNHSILPPTRSHPGYFSVQQQLAPYYGMGLNPPISSYVPQDIYGGINLGYPSPPPSPYHTMSPPVPLPMHSAPRKYSFQQIEGVNLFVFHLPSEVDDEYIFRLFSPFGALESVKVIADKNSGESKGYGFVKYYRMADALAAISSMNGYQIGGKHLKVSFKTTAPIRGSSPRSPELHGINPVNDNDLAEPDDASTNVSSVSESISGNINNGNSSSVSSSVSSNKPNLPHSPQGSSLTAHK